jgi:hypothetical protein
MHRLLIRQSPLLVLCEKGSNAESAGMHIDVHVWRIFRRGCRRGCVLFLGIDIYTQNVCVARHAVFLKKADSYVEVVCVVGKGVDS